MSCPVPSTASVCLGAALGVSLALLAPASLAADDAPLIASLQVSESGGGVVSLPLEHTEVRGEVSGFVARVEVIQAFGNPFDEPIEATYVFPLPERAAVDDFLMEVGPRRIRGEIRRREEARQIYEQARAAGHTASLLEQERPNIFTQSVANILPGHVIRVHLRYVDLLPYEDGSFRFLFPMVVGPRYLSGTRGGAAPAPPHDAEAARIRPPALRPGFRSGHDIALTLDLEGAVPLGPLVSDSHEIVVERTGTKRARVSLSAHDQVPNKDFMLRIQVAAELPEVGFIAHRTGDDGYFALQLQPKAAIAVEEAAPKEILFVLDQSGSMDGPPIEMSKRFMRRALETLGPHDSFNIIRFSSGAQALSPAPLPSDPESIALGLRTIRAMDANGGTEFLLGLREAMHQPHDPARLRILFFLSDGFIGDEQRIFDAIRQEAGDARVFTLGIGSSVNHYLLREMAALGRGAYQYIRPDGREEEALRRFHAWVTLPYLTDLEIDWGGLQVEDLHPAPLPDLFSGQVLTLVGRYLWGGDETVIVRGRLGGRRWERQVPVHLPEREESHAALASVWARHRIRELLLGGSSRPEIEYQVTSLALSFRLLSPFTSFVAVDESEVANPGGEPRLVRQALPLPEFVSFEGCFGAEGPTAVHSPPPTLPEDSEPTDGIVTVEVHDESGPARGAHVLLRASPTGEVAERLTGDDGIARFDRLPPGYYRLAAIYRGGLFESNAFEVAPGAALEVAIQTAAAPTPEPEGTDTVADEPGDPGQPAGWARLTGLVVDNDGNPIPGVTVIVASGSWATAPVSMLTDAQGRYSFPRLRPAGDCEVSAELPGFARVVTSPIRLEAGRTTTQNVTLVPAAAMTERITVTGKGNLVDAASTKTATVFASEPVEGSPVLGRTYQDILSLAPGVIDAEDAAVPGGVPGGVVGGVLGGVVGGVLGGIVGGVAAEEEGTDHADRVTGMSGGNLALESIAEIEIITTGASASFSQAQGGFVPILSKRSAAAVPALASRARAVLPDPPTARVVEPALRVLADLAIDRRLSRAEGVPALAGLLAAQDARGRLGGSLTEHALATWAIAEAARAHPEVPWLARAVEAAVAELRAAAYKLDEWPARRGGAVDPLTTALSRLALRSAWGDRHPQAALDLSAIEGGLCEFVGPSGGRLLERVIAGLRGGSLLAVEATRFRVEPEARHLR